MAKTYETKIAQVYGEPLSIIQKIAIKNGDKGTKIVDLLKDTPAVGITLDKFAVVDVNNHKDDPFTQTVLFNGDEIYTTSSTSLLNSLENIYESLTDEVENLIDFTIEVYTRPSKSGKQDMLLCRLSAYN